MVDIPSSHRCFSYNNNSIYVLLHCEQSREKKNSNYLQHLYTDAEQSTIPIGVREREKLRTYDRRQVRLESYYI